MPEEPPWDVRLVEWMQESARYRKRPPKGAIDRAEAIGWLLPLILAAAFWAVTGIDTWPVIGGLLTGIGVRVVQDRHAARNGSTEPDGA
jgi:hypothetical protein